VSEILFCSAKGCRAPAEWALRWNNPKLHAPQRRKTWLACAEHRESLGDFLSARGFLREVTPASPDPAAAEPDSAVAQGSAADPQSGPAAPDPADRTRPTPPDRT
jgi:hypothetical protein